MNVSARLLFASLVVVLITALNGCGSGGDETGVRIGDSSAWFVWSVHAPRTLTVGTGVDYCVGDPKPRFGHPEIKYRGNDVFITLTIERPPAPPAKPNEICGGVELLVKRRITLKRDLDDVEVFDGGVDPPQQQWPD